MKKKPKFHKVYVNVALGYYKSSTKKRKKDLVIPDIMFYGCDFSEPEYVVAGDNLVTTNKPLLFPLSSQN